MERFFLGTYFILFSSNIYWSIEDKEIWWHTSLIMQWHILTFDYTMRYINQNTIEKWTKDSIFPFSKKGNLRISKNYRGKTLTAIASKVYNELFHNHNRPEVEKVLRKNQNGFQRNWSTTFQILIIHCIIEGVQEINLKATHLVV